MEGDANKAHTRKGMSVGGYLTRPSMYLNDVLFLLVVDVRDRLSLPLSFPLSFSFLFCC